MAPGRQSGPVNSAEGARQVCLVDASVYIFRAWHSLPPNWKDREGWPTHAAQGFCHVLLQLLEQLKPPHLGVCFDEALDSCFRNDIYPAYKANREPPDEALLRQFGACRRIADALGLAAFGDPRYEADDLIGSLAQAMRPHGLTLLLVSADKDLTQLLESGDRQWDLGRDRWLDPAAVQESFGVQPGQIADLLALAGDAVDNIPGVQGVGRVTAARLLRHFGDLDALYARLDELPRLPLRGAAALAQRLAEQRDIAYLSRQLTRIHCGAPVPDHPEALTPRQPDPAKLAALFEELGFGPALLRRARRVTGA